MGCRLITAIQDTSIVQIHALSGFQSHKTELLGHTVLGHHGSRQISRLLDIIGCSGGNRIKYYFLCCTASHAYDQTGKNLFLGQKELLFLRCLQYIAKSSAGTRNDRDLLYRLSILLKCTGQCMTNLMIGYHFPFFFT